MIIVAEAFDSEFFDRFVSFIKAGDYQHRDKAEKYELYQFESPTEKSFPPKIELLGKRPEYLTGAETHLGRFRTIDAEGSLSAILLDDEYYGLLEKGIVEIGGLPVLSLEYLPVFKMHAWANLTDDKAAGKTVHGDEIKKHRRDVLRLCSLFAPGTCVELPESIAVDVERFVEERPWDDNVMRNLGLSISANDMAAVIGEAYLGR